MPEGYWDIHNHILPGLDDGASCMEETYDLIQEEYRQGIRDIIFTPHYRPGMFQVGADEREMVYRESSAQLQKDFPDMRFFLGCECFVHEGMDRKLSDSRYRMADTSVVLTEFHRGIPFPELQQWIWRIIQWGYHPVIAHAERYRCLYQRETAMMRLRREGAYVQVNAGSILGRDGRRIKHFCIRALQTGQVDFIASDAHNMDSRPVELSVCRKYTEKKFGKEKTDWWFGLAQKQIFTDFQEGKQAKR